MFPRAQLEVAGTSIVGRATRRAGWLAEPAWRRNSRGCHMTTHVLSSGIAGTMAANGSGLQWSTIRNIALAWVLTLPAAMILSGLLYLVFSKLF
jgi:hypothetical protein